MKKKLSGKYQTPQVPEGYISSWAQYTLVSDNRDLEMEKYREKGIPTMIYYGTCMHQQTAFKQLINLNKKYPIATKLAKNVFSLPIHGYM